MENAFRSIVPTQAASTNVPDVLPPEFPRLLLQGQRRAIQVSQVAAQLELEFGRSTQSIGETLETFTNTARSFFTAIAALKPRDQRRDAGIALVINYPSTAGSEELSASLYGRLVRMPQFGTISSVGVQAGFRTPEGLYKNFAIDSYILKRGTPPSTPSAEEGDVIERGQQVKLDVNNKPMFLGLATRDDNLELILTTIGAMVLRDVVTIFPDEAV